MHRSLSWMSGLLVFALLGAFPALSQVFEVSAGASTSYGAEGASVTIEGSNSQTLLGAGIIQGHFAAGGSSSRPVAHGTLTVGQANFQMDLPTDVFDYSHFFYGTGIGFKSSSTASQLVEGFAGFESREGGTPLFHTASVGHAALYSRWIHPFTEECSWILTGLRSSQSALLGSLGCRHSPALQYAFTLGNGGGSPYAAASVVFNQRRLKVKAAYIYAGHKFQRANDIYQPTRSLQNRTP